MELSYNDNLTFHSSYLSMKKKGDKNYFRFRQIMFLCISQESVFVYHQGVASFLLYF